jgi:hypothetical protein
VVTIIAFRQAGAKKHATEVNVIGNIAAMEVSDFDTKITFQDLHGHGSLLLSDAREGVEATLKLIGGWFVRPYGRGVAAVLTNDSAASKGKPARNVLNVTMQFRRLVHGSVNGSLVAGDSLRVKMA